MLIIKFLILFVTLSITVWFVNYKFSKAVRVLAFGEAEEPTEAKVAFGAMVVLVIMWTIYLTFF